MSRRGMAGFCTRGVLPAVMLLLCLSVRVTRAESDALQQVREAAGRIQSLQAAFVQEKQLAILVRPLISMGRFYFKAPDAIRWEYESPARSLFLLSDGDARRFFERDGRLVPDSGADLQAMQIVLQHITNWLRGRFDESPDFRIEPHRDRIILVPSAALSGMIRRIELLLSQQPGIIDQILIVENERDFTKISFRDLKVNHPIAASVFRPLP